MKTNKYNMLYYILGMTFGVPTIGLLSKVIGKLLGFLEKESILSITKEYIVVCIAANGLVGVVFLCIGLLLLKDTARAVVSKNRDKPQHVTPPAEAAVSHRPASGITHATRPAAGGDFMRPSSQRPRRRDHNPRPASAAVPAMMSDDGSGTAVVVTCIWYRPSLFG